MGMPILTIQGQQQQPVGVGTPPGMTPNSGCPELSVCAPS